MTEVKKYHHTIIFCGYLLQVDAIVSAASTDKFVCLCTLDGVGLGPWVWAGGFPWREAEGEGVALIKLTCSEILKVKKLTKCFVLQEIQRISNYFDILKK